MAREHSAEACAHIPVRTCIGCRDRAPKQELLRVVARDSDGGVSVLPDPEARETGRGAYIHPRLDCLELAVRRKAFPRAFKVRGRVTESPLRDHLQRAADPSVLTDRKWSSSS